MDQNLPYLSKLSKYLKVMHMNRVIQNGIYFGAGLIVCFLIFGAVLNSTTPTAAQNSIDSATNTQLANQPSQQGSGNAQAVKVVVQGSSYVFSPAEFKQGPVRLEFDMTTLVGCSRSIVIPEFGIRKTLSEGDNVVEFTPTKAGTFNIACSMNMYRGTFTVLQADGSKSSYVQPAPAPSAGGGCGCGGGAAKAASPLPSGGSCH
jgi:plastocyanin